MAHLQRRRVLSHRGDSLREDYSKKVDFDKGDKEVKFDLEDPSKLELRHSYFLRKIQALVVTRGGKCEWRAEEKEILGMRRRLIATAAGEVRRSEPPTITILLYIRVFLSIFTEREWGVPELVVIAGVAALVFGPKKLPEVGGSIGKTVKSFQQVMYDASRVRLHAGQQAEQQDLTVEGVSEVENEFDQSLRDFNSKIPISFCVQPLHL
ncbi:sec-independent protein translocase protein TATA, chloroplastic [Senna tora]|uniref:Sec-independent protein translocase protein TATA, chloroplastic n=1 Tax=Senna tora TaxID=362788 RepID=A0A834SUH1_9FABA|nr:sec-independent protein translocase protein TATA, chloroplastic [Senna tora]